MNSEDLDDYHGDSIITCVENTGDIVRWNINGAKTENPLLPGVTKLISMLFFGDIN